MTRPKILQVITSTQRRGAEQFAVGLGAELEQRSFDVDTVALSASEGGFDVEVLGEGLGPRSLGRLRSLMRRADLTIAHGSRTLPACALASAASPARFVYRNIGDPYFWGSTVRRRLQSRLLLSTAARVVALTPTTAARISEVYRVPSDRIVAIPRGVPTDRFRPASPSERATARRHFGLADDDHVVVWVGSLTEEKDASLAVRTSALTDGVLLMVGDGPERAELAELAERVAPGQVRFAGATDRPELAYAAADLLLLTSRTEGLPGVVIEAALAGLPSVTTDVGFVRDLVSDDSGRVVTPSTPEGLAAAVAEVSADRRRLGANAHEHVLQGYSLDAVADRWASVLDDVLGAVPAGRSRS